MPDADLISTSFLESLADSLCSTVAEKGEGLLVHIGAEADGASVGVLPLDDRAPTDLLLGATAPLEWLVLGVATLGTARSLDSKSSLGRAAVVVLAARDGRVVGCLRHDGRVITEAPATGYTLDCLRLALGLPTPPPEVPPAHVYAVLSLERLAGGGGHAAVLELLKSTEDLVRWLDWDRVRRLTVAVAGDELGLTAEDANWLDNGAFARWVTGAFPPLPDLIAAVQRRRGAAGAELCTQFLRRLGLDAPALRREA
jgi:hypothetical protein